MTERGRHPEVGLALRNCAACGTEFQPYRSHQIACSRPCRDRTKDQSPRRTEYELTCRECGIHFTAMWTGMGRQPACPTCTAALADSQRKRKNVARRITENPARREVNFRQNVRRYGLTLEQYEAMLTAQAGVCAICGSPPDPRGVKAQSRLHIDHDATTGRVRGLLCGRCNPGIGYLMHDVSRLQAAIAYLNRT